MGNPSVLVLVENAFYLMAPTEIKLRIILAQRGPHFQSKHSYDSVEEGLRMSEEEKILKEKMNLSQKTS